MVLLLGTRMARLVRGIDNNTAVKMESYIDDNDNLCAPYSLFGGQLLFTWDGYSQQLLHASLHGWYLLGGMVLASALIHGQLY